MTTLSREQAPGYGERIAGGVVGIAAFAGDWIARGAVAGLAAGFVFLLGNMAYASDQGKPAVAPLLDISTIYHGSSGMPEATPENMIIGLVTHVSLSMLFGIGFALLLAPFLRNALVLAGAGIAYGLALYVVNFQILGNTFFEWFTDPRGPNQGFEIIMHGVFGLLLVPFFIGLAARLASRS